VTPPQATGSIVRPDIASRLRAEEAGDQKAAEPDCSITRPEDTSRSPGLFGRVPEFLESRRDSNGRRVASGVSDRACRLYAVLTRFANSGGVAWPSRQTLATRLGCSAASIDRAVIELVDAGAIRVRTPAHRQSNLYTVLPEPPGEVSSPVMRPPGEVSSPVMRPPGEVSSPVMRPPGEVSSPVMRPPGEVSSPVMTNPEPSTKAHQPGGPAGIICSRATATATANPAKNRTNGCHPLLADSQRALALALDLPPGATAGQRVRDALMAALGSGWDPGALASAIAAEGPLAGARSTAAVLAHRIVDLSQLPPPPTTRGPTDRLAADVDHWTARVRRDPGARPAAENDLQAEHGSDAVTALRIRLTTTNQGA
jgi:hypothetical protein